MFTSPCHKPLSVAPHWRLFKVAVFIEEDMAVSYTVSVKRMPKKYLPSSNLVFVDSKRDDYSCICVLFFRVSAEGSCRVSVAVPPCVRQVVLFSSGPWGERICVNAELNDADRILITIGKLTPYNKYVHSDCVLIYFRVNVDCCDISGRCPTSESSYCILLSTDNNGSSQ